MGTWTSLVVLSLAVVSTLSFPRPDAEYKIPTVGLGSRAQYYVLHSDGTYKYGFDSGDGTYEQSMALVPGEVTGAFGYKDPTGADIKLEYTADDRGFIASGAHLPVAPEGDFGSRVNAAASPTYTASPASVYTADPSAPVEVSHIRSSANNDGSYSFSYDASSSSRAESADAHNSVTGQYAFIADDGINREIKYIAGSETGYIAEGDSLPRGPSVPGAESGIPTGRILPVLSEEEANALAAPSSGSSGAATYAAVPSSSSGSSDASYSFRYDAGDSSRHESADADLNIEGSYSFTPPEGHRLTVNYIAGSDTGFVATGDHLPVAPDADFVPGVDGASAGTGYVVPYSAPSAASPSAAVAAAPSAPAASTRTAGTSSSDASYSFSYDAGDSARSESADADLNIEGSYSFVPPEGHRLTVNYIAGSDTGFVATGDHLPVAPDADFGSRVSGAAPSAAVYSPASATSSASVYASDPATYASAPIEEAKVRSSAANDGSYNFAYDTSSSSRSESADAHNSVTGHYAFVADDGINREIKYIAGSETGYIAEGDSLPRGPSVPGAESGIPTGRILPVLSEEEANALSAPSSGSSGAATYAAVPSSSSGSSDASYSFRYDAGDSSRHESADADLNIEGSYSFTPPEGHRLTVNYIAGSDTGFVATGDHLPVAPDADFVPGVDEASAGTGYVVPYSAPSAASPSAAVAAAPSAPAASTRTAGTSSSDASYSFSYDAGDSARSESADADLNIEGSYSFVPPEGHRLTVNYIAGSDTGFVATGDHLPVAPDADFGSRVSGAASGAATYSATSAATSASSSTSGAASAPFEVAQVRSSAADDGSYSFAYDTSSSSRSESADAQNSVKGRYAFVADDGINREIKYIAGSETGYIAEGDSLPIGPSVPGAESGIPTGRILPVLSEEEANALAATSYASGASPLLKSGAGIDAAATPADASYSFSFASDSYSRNEEADADGNVVGSYTFLDEYGNEHTVNFVAGEETGFLPEGFPTPATGSAPAAAPASASGAPSAFSAPSGAGRPSTKSAGATSASKYSSAQGTSSSAGHSSHIVGDVLLHQYGAVNRDKYGYVFTALRR